MSTTLEVGTRVRSLASTADYWTPPAGKLGTVIETGYYAIDDEFEVQWDDIDWDTFYYRPSHLGDVLEVVTIEDKKEDA